MKVRSASIVEFFQRLTKEFISHDEKRYLLLPVCQDRITSSNRYMYCLELTTWISSDRRIHQPIHFLLVQWFLVSSHLIHP